MKQTAVEWLEEIAMNGFITPEDFEQAKEMEKGQIEDSWKNGIENCVEFNNPTIINGKQYYNKIYEAKED